MEENACKIQRKDQRGVRQTRTRTRDPIIPVSRRQAQHEEPPLSTSHREKRLYLPPSSEFLSVVSEDKPGAASIKGAKNMDDIPSSLKEKGSSHAMMLVAEIVPDQEEVSIINEQEQAEIEQQAVKQVEERIRVSKKIDHNSPKRRKWIVIGVVVAVLVVAGTAAGIALAIGRNNETQEAPWEEPESPSTFSTFPPATESFFVDECDETISMEWQNVDLLTTSLFGTTIDASQDISMASCTGQPNGKEVWYRIQGIGNRLVAHTCSNTHFDTQISVYSGKACDLLQRVQGNDQLK